MNVKFCGLSGADEIEHAHRLGASHVGLVVQAPRSHRNLALEDAARLARSAPGELTRVLVTPADAVDRIGQALDGVPVDILQASGDVAPRELASLSEDARVRAWKALGLAEDPETTLDRIAEFGQADAVVLDALSEGYGGHGETVDWTQARRLVQQSPTDVVLAGGLTPGNVAQAIREVDPWCVDVSSGIETDQRKDPDKMAAFAQAVSREVTP